MSTKRHSFSPGPRALHLALSTTSISGSSASGNSTFTSHSTSSPHSESSGSTSAPSSATRFVRSPGAPRRQSSISYYAANDSETRNATLRATAKHGLTRSVSVGAKPPFSSGAGIGIGNRSTGSVECSQSEKVNTPHTLAERHADLLQFIAQKESKCLELRSQLSVHEAELLQLKRRWERIVNRGFERSNGINDYTSASNSASAAAQSQGGAVLDGIREGVQGVSRLISAGLGELSSNTPYPSVPPSRALGSSSSKTGAARRRHSTQPSSSSASTYATNASGSTRLSQSSASSLGEETVLPEGGEGDDDKVDWEGESKPMVKETGATPTLSHESVFVSKPKPGLSELSIDLGNNSVLPSSPADTRATKLHRRKSKDAAPSTFTSDPFELSTTSGVRDSTGVKQTLKAKRASMSGLSPASSKSGHGSLTADGGQPVASWVGSVGKKWEEIQRGPTFTVGQKRASLLLSDMTQSIASALLSPQSASYNSIPASNHCNRLPPYSSSSSSRSITPFQSSSSVSLLDEDDTDTTARGGLDELGWGDVMMPVHVSAQPSPPANASMGVKKESVAPRRTTPPDDDEEWGW